ncbi:hypothetical protein PLICRDRAFT_254172 [Plicaturopsis crispa FD-325 SS-3]|nr:hypothetical protein PLICRDRAFT_254172 [Plicaturopsis crispa FD-325 SS-3]
METSSPDSIPFNLDVVSAFSKSDVVDAARQHVDNEIAALERSIWAFKTRRNEFALISRLPPEILSEVFLCGRAMHTPERDTRWIKVTYVCRHWRDVALDCPRFWSYIIPRTLKWTQELLARSKDAPLTIVSTTPYPTQNMELSLELALTHISRVSMLHLTSTARCMERVFDPLAAKAAPLLESLELEVPDHNPYNIPETFCTGINPMLRNLSLGSCSIPWGSRFLDNLKVLKLKAIPVASRLSLSDILAILRRASESLTVFEIKDSIQYCEENSDVSEEAVDLPRLTSVHIKSRAREGGMLLKRLLFSPTAAITMDCVLNKGVKTDMMNMLPTFAVSSTSGPRLRSLDVQLTPGDRILEIRGWTESNVDPAASQHVHAPKFTLRLNFWPIMTGAANSAKLATLICKTLSVSHLENISVMDMEGMSGTAWLTTFGQCTLIRKVAVSDAAAKGLVVALDPDARVGHKKGHVSTRPPGAIFLPALKELEFSSVSFEGEDPTGVRVRNLCKCLTGRAKHDAKLERLSIEDCMFFGGEQVDQLEKVVDDVDWDGVVSHGTDDDDPYGEDEDYDSSDYDD